MTNVLCIVSLHSARRVVWNDIKAMVDDAGLSSRCEFHETSMRCTLPNGTRIYLAGCSSSHDVDKLRGITWDEVLVDEAVSATLRDELRKVLAPSVRGRFETINDDHGHFHILIRASVLRAVLSADYDNHAEALDLAWGLIANAGGGDWTKESQVWRAAAARWRDEHYCKPTTSEIPRAPVDDLIDDWKQELAEWLRKQLREQFPLKSQAALDHVTRIVELLERLENPLRFGAFPAGIMSGARIREP